MSSKEILFRLYNNYIKNYLSKIFIALILSILVAGSTSSIAWLLDPAIKKIFIDKDKELLLLIPLVIIAAFAIKGFSLYFARISIAQVAAGVEKDVRLDVAKSLINSDIQRIENKHSGKYIAHFLYDVTILNGLVGTCVLSLMKDSLTLIALLGVMFYQNWRLALFAMIMIPLAALAARTLGKRMKKITTETQETYGELSKYLAELIKNSKIVKIYQKEKFEINRAQKFIDELKKKGIKISVVLFRATPVMETLTGIMIGGLIYYAGLMVHDGKIEINNFFSFLAAMMLAYQPVRSLATLNMSINQGLSAGKRLFKIIDEKQHIYNDPNQKSLIIDKAKIEFRNVSFVYTSKQEKVLKSINLKINGGEVAALVGHSGAGKTTIMNLIPRLYNVSSGEILIDDQSINGVNLSSLRKKISFVSQDITLFDDSVISNVNYAGSEVPKEKVIEACKYSAADDFIKKLPQQYDTIIGENGVRLSGGEKQRVSIARAILKNAPIILLDEATSSLDSETEHKIQEAIMYLTKNKTTIIIAHRLSTILKADKIFVINHGEVVAEGNHNFLLENSKIYKNFYDKQLKKH